MNTVQDMEIINLVEEVVHGVLQVAEHIRDSIVAIEEGPLESLRWSGALELLLRDFGIEKLVSLDRLRECRSQEDVLWLLKPADFVADPSNASSVIPHLVVITSGFLWEYESDFLRLREMKIVQRFTVCSTVSENAHECYDFEKHGKDPQEKMIFSAYSRHLEGISNTQDSTADNTTCLDNMDDWNWEESHESTFNNCPGKSNMSEKKKWRVRIYYLFLSYSPLFVADKSSADLSLFILSNPLCTTTFPLLLSQLAYNKSEKQYANVKDVKPEHIPTSFRRKLRLLSYVLGETLTQWHLEVKERIYTVGATSLKIGHTLLRILQDLEREFTPQEVQRLKPASIIIVDRTSDLLPSASFGTSLVEHILELLPSASLDTQHSPCSSITERFPLHSSLPYPSKSASSLESYMSSPFISTLKWKGGMSLCHSVHSVGASIFRSLFLRPAQDALRKLDKSLQKIERELIQTGSIVKTCKKSDSEKKSNRGRDVVLRRINNILHAGEPLDKGRVGVIEVSVAILETIQRMDKSQPYRKKFSEITKRQLELRQQKACEWIIPELADVVQRYISSNDAECLSVNDVLLLFVQAFSMSAGVDIEDYTIQMIQNAISDLLLREVLKNHSSYDTNIVRLFPRLLSELPADKPNDIISVQEDLSLIEDFTHEEETWEWEESPKKPSSERINSVDNVRKLQARAIVKEFSEEILGTLQECRQQSLSECREIKATHSSILATIYKDIVGLNSSPQLHLERIIDASEQLTRAGIDLLKSGFSRFGLGGTSHRLENGSGIDSSEIVVIFVVGGISLQEIFEINDLLGQNTKYQFIIGGNTITTQEQILSQLFKKDVRH